MKFAVPLAISHVALQHDSSVQALVPTVIFPPAACWKLLLIITLSQRNSQLIQEVPWIKKQTTKSAEIVVWYLRRLTPENELFYACWVNPSNDFPLFGAPMESTFHCTHCTHGGQIQYSLQILGKVLVDLGDLQVPCSFWGWYGWTIHG